MNRINWFPGHMAKATRELETRLKNLNLIIEVVDARIPLSSQNPNLARLIKHKIRLIVLNKSDLADRNMTNQWVAYFNAQSDTHCLAINALNKKDMKSIISFCELQLKTQTKRFQRLNVAIAGIPNVGKSQLINQLSGRKSAKVANRPAVTQNQQWVKLSDYIYLMDTPGILWPKLETEQIGYHLAVTGSIKDTVINREDIIDYLLIFVLKHYPRLIQARFGCDVIPDSVDALIEFIAKKRGCIKRGNEIDLEKVYTLILKEFRTGKWGPMSLERPSLIR